VRFPISRAAFDQDAGISTQTLIFWTKRSSQYAARLSILPHYITRQVSFVLQRQLAQSGKQLPGLKLELPKVPRAVTSSTTGRSPPGRDHPSPGNGFVTG